MLSVIYSEKFLQHKTGRSHPESPERLTAIAEALSQVDWKSQLSCQLLSDRDSLPYIQQVHTLEHIARIRDIAVKGGGYLTPDTPVSRYSYEVALLAVNAWLDGVDLVLETENPAFVLARPPGHHATRDQAMGFCLESRSSIGMSITVMELKIL